MRTILLATTALLFQAGAASALQHPQPAVPIDRGGDPHVQVAVYDPSQPVLVVGAVGRPMTITFGPAESVRRIALESAAAIDGKEAVAPWQGPDAAQAGSTPLGNVLPLWVMRAGRSNAQVITGDGGGIQRVYQFQLIALPAQPNDCASDDCDDPRLTTGLTFRYPAERKQENDAAIVQSLAVGQKLAAEDRLKADFLYGPRNWQYDIKGQPGAVKDLAPDGISDNTQVTALLYLGNRQVPSLFIVEPDGRERQVTPTPEKDLLTVSETAFHWRLRKGSEVADLYNVGFDNIGANPYTGTISPNVIRTIRADAGK